MDVEITPDPEPLQRDAIEAALQKLLEARIEPAAYASAWRRAGLEEAVSPQAADVRPRTSFGATRA